MRGSAPGGPSAAPPVPPCRVIVIGAGVAGLACAQELRHASHLNLEVTVLEARNRVGGRIFTTWLSPQAALNSTDADSPPVSQPEKTAQPTRARTRQRNSMRKPANPQTNAISSNPNSIPRRPPRRHSFSDLVNGVIVPARYETDGTPRTSVDIGASIMHGCGDASQLVFKRAIQDKIRAPVVAGGGFYESTEYALWFDDKTGQHVSTNKIAEVHNIFFMASRYMAAVAACSDDGTADMQSMFECGVSYVCEQLGGRMLDPVENAILRKICARSVGYCSPMSTMALMQASAGMDSASIDNHIGVPYEEDDQPYPGEIPPMTSVGIKLQAQRLSRSIASGQRLPKAMIASRKGGTGDRIILDGYTPFLTDSLAEGIDVRLAQAVCAVSCAAAVKVPATEMTDEFEDVGRSTARSVKDPNISAQPVRSWHNDPEVASRTIFVSTRTGEVYQADFVVVTLPLGVLKGSHGESSVTFSPPLSEDKQEAIRGMGMGVHNKIILRFREEDVFWPPKVPQLNCLDPRFQFFNLHSYGKPGVLLVQVFAESGFAKGYSGLSDEQVVAEVLAVLGGMFCNREDGVSTNGMKSEQTTDTTTIEAKRRIAQILHVCENCHKSLRARLANGPKLKSDGLHPCQSCGHVSQVPAEGLKQVQEKTEWSSRLRERPEKETVSPAQPRIVKLQEELEIEMGSRQENLTWSNFPAPEEYIVTRWDKDPYSLGSYSYMPCGSSWHMIEQMACPEPRGSPNPYLFFAGEHCSDLGWQCVHGAYETGINAGREIIKLVSAGIPEKPDSDIPINDVPIPRVAPTGPKPAGPPERDTFWTNEREKALTRALVGYSDVYGNLTDVIDEIAFALQSFKKEPTQLTRQRVTELVEKRIHEKVEEGNADAKTFINFHNGIKGTQEEAFQKPFHEIHRRPRIVGLNGHKLKERYADDIVQELKSYANVVHENRISYREALRKIALKIYKMDGGLMTKRCLSEYLRTQEFGTGPQKELFLEKYLQAPK